MQETEDLSRFRCTKKRSVKHKGVIFTFVALQSETTLEDQIYCFAL